MARQRRSEALAARGGGATNAFLPPWWRTSDGDCLLVRVRVTPKSGLDKVSGLAETADGPAVQVKVRAAPADGAANRAVLETLAGWLGCPKSNLSIAAGAKSRVKVVAVRATPEAAKLVGDRCAALVG